MINRKVILTIATLWSVHATSALAQDAQVRCTPLAESTDCASRELTALVEQHSQIEGRKTQAGNTPDATRLTAALQLNEQTQEALRQWFDANAAWRDAEDKRGESEKRIFDLEALGPVVRDSDALQRLVEAEKKTRDALVASVKTLLAARGEKWSTFVLRRDVAMALAGPVSLDTASTNDPRPEEANRKNQIVSCPIADPTAPEVVVYSTNIFQKCIGLSHWRDFPSSELNVNLAASSDTTLSFIPSYTQFRRSDLSDGEAFNWYWKAFGGVSVKLDKDKKSATFADLTTFDLMKGIEYIGGVEFGFSENQSREKFIEDARTGLLAARRACITYYLSDPFAGRLAATDVQPRTPDQAASQCTGTKLTAWIAEDPGRRETYYRSIVKPQWGYDRVDTLYFGVEGRLSEPSLSYYPFFDPAGTGTPLITALPDNFPKGDTKVEPTLFSLTGYVGTVANEYLGVSASVSYGRRADFLKDFGDVSINGQRPGTPYEENFTINTAPPYITEGWSVAGRFAVQTPRVLFFPQVGIEAKASYRFDIDQWGFQVPIRAFLDDKGKATGGVLIGCTTDGHTTNGFEIAGECKASLFVGTAFSLAGKP